MLKKRYVQDMPEMTVCLGFMRDGPDGRFARIDSPLMLFICRHICYDKDVFDPMSSDGKIDCLKLSVCGNRSLLNKWEPRANDKIYLYPLDGADQFWMFLTVRDVCRVPRRVRDILYGPMIPQLPGMGAASQGREEISSTTDENVLREAEDEGCLQYLDKLKENQCNQSQKKALLTSLREMGTMEYNSASVYLIVGPPGAGKSTCISLLVGSILHHSLAGHFHENMKSFNLLNRQDGLVQYSQKSEICESSDCRKQQRFCQQRG